MIFERLGLNHKLCRSEYIYIFILFNSSDSFILDSIIFSSFYYSVNCFFHE